MKLYELGRGKKFKLLTESGVPPIAPAVTIGNTYRLGNIDGMYSYCTDELNNVVHIQAWADVEEIT